MTVFHFPLQQLLELRSQAEDEARCELAEAQREAERQRERLQRLRQAVADAANLAAPKPGQAVEPATLLSNGLHLAHLRKQTVAQQARADQSNRQESSQRQRLVEAARNHEILARLRQNRFDEHQCAQAVAENRALDEAGTMAFMRQRDDS